MCVCLCVSVYVCVCVCVTCLYVCALEKILNFICIANREEQNLKSNAKNRKIAINTAIIRYASETYAQFKDKSTKGGGWGCRQLQLLGRGSGNRRADKIDSTEKKEQKRK